MIRTTTVVEDAVPRSPVMSVSRPYHPKLKLRQREELVNERSTFPKRIGTRFKAEVVVKGQHTLSCPDESRVSSACYSPLSDP